MAVGSPSPPSTAGKGNQLRSANGCWSGVRDAITPGSHAPMSSMAAWWLASRPADDPAPVPPRARGAPPASLGADTAAFTSPGVAGAAPIALGEKGAWPAAHWYY